MRSLDGSVSWRGFDEVSECGPWMRSIGTVSQRVSSLLVVSLCGLGLLVLSLCGLSMRSRGGLDAVSRCLVSRSPGSDEASIVRDDKVVYTDLASKMVVIPYYVFSTGNHMRQVCVATGSRK